MFFTMQYKVLIILNVLYIRDDLGMNESVGTYETTQSMTVPDDVGLLTFFYSLCIRPSVLGLRQLTGRRCSRVSSSLKLQLGIRIARELLELPLLLFLILMSNARFSDCIAFSYIGQSSSWYKVVSISRIRSVF